MAEETSLGEWPLGYSLDMSTDISLPVSEF